MSVASVQCKTCSTSSSSQYGLPECHVQAKQPIRYKLQAGGEGQGALPHLGRQILHAARLARAALRVDAGV